MLFSTLPAPPSRSRLFVVGWGLQVLALAMLVALNAMFPYAIPQARKYVVTNLVSYQPLVPAETQPVKPRLDLPKTVKVPIVEPSAVAKIVLPAPRSTQPQVDVKAPEVKMESKLPQLPAATVPKVVAMNTFSTGSSAVPTTTKPAAAVQTGGFGDPNGVRPSTEHQASANIASVGAFNLPSGAGRGNGTGGANPGVVTSTGFGNGIAVGSRRGSGVVQQTAFDAQYVSSEPHKTAASSAAVTTPVEIVSKPRPEYTVEARKQAIDGEVRLEVLFSANGQVHVIRVVEGLGYGLDEQAVKAALQIKFKPELHEGQPVDSTAVVHIIFQLAS